ncbi:MAG: tRNA (guanosine(37)-N1)-methyltransferase TrmD, partial [Phreatobacter sp.]|nr:tRNA (guanosine(37)-N1)-methyltransferase TrmD [Phreatobacter sp.]
DTHFIRGFATDRHRTVDDTPAGGGPGMVMKADVVARAIDHVSPDGDTRPRLYMSPRGRPLTQDHVRDLAAGPGAVILCGRFEGVDERLIAARGLTEVSIGDYVLSGGELAAMVLIDAVVRLLPGVMGHAESGTEESFETGLLEYPHYTRPQVFEGLTIPEILVSGDHAKIAKWRRDEAERLTRERRPDLWAKRGSRG